MAVDQGTLENLKGIVEEHGLGEALYEQMKELKDQWKREHVSIAVVGSARQGKSSHINAHMGAEVAEVKSTRRVTKEVKSYLHPRNPNIVIYDTPGIDANQHSRDEWERVIKYKENNYDFFLIISQDIFSGDSKWIADKIQEWNKRYYFVRTKVDVSIEDEKRRSPLATEDEIIAEIRFNLEKDFNDLGFCTNSIKVYLVNNYDTSNPLLDFETLQDDICSNLESEIKREALMITIGEHNSVLIEQKYKMFVKRIWKVSVISGLGGAVPVPGISAAIDLALIVEEYLLYIESFGLSKEGIKALEKLNGVEEGYIERGLQEYLKSNNKTLHSVREVVRAALTQDTLSASSIKDIVPVVIKNAGEFVAKVVAANVASEAVESSVKYLIGVIGLAMSAAISYGVTNYQLQQLLKELKGAAVFANRYVTDQERKRLDAYELP